MLLAIAVILPTLCLLWFMNSAVKNERLAVRQRLVSSYAESLEKLKVYNEDIWLKLTDIPARILSEGAPGFLTAIVRTQNYGKGDYDHGDAVLVYDANGALAYPVLKDYEPNAADVNESLWQLEFTAQDYAAAARQYRRIAGKSADEAAKLYAEIAAIRNLKKSGDMAAALKECDRIIESARQPDIRQFNLLMQLRIMQIRMSKDAGSLDYPLLVKRFLEQAAEYTGVGDYALSISDSGLLPSTSRIFFLRKSVEFAHDPTLNIAPDKVQPAEKLLATEMLSLELADKYPDASAVAGWPERTARRIDHHSDLFGYVAAASGKKALIVFDADNLRIFFEVYATTSFPKDLDYTIADDTGRRVLGVENPTGQALLKHPVSKYFPRWDISAFLKDDDLFASAAQRQTAVYIWVGVLVVALILVTGGFAGRALGRQMKLNRLKNDFIATVSHELKTPLASMRVLADTLLDGNYKDQRQATEYLELICKENRRLSGLIDNFLTFSRMERNKRAFDMSPTSPADIARADADAVKTKFGQRGCRLEIEIAEGLPDVSADRDAMVTVLVNLLDNACKYSYDDKQIMLKAFAEEGCVCFSVTDNGIGMTRRQIKRIFDRFYQVDRSLSRRAEGCGLGLSIAKFIVDAHKGTITVESMPGKGSTFTVKLPLVT